MDAVFTGKLRRAALLAMAALVCGAGKNALAQTVSYKTALEIAAANIKEGITGKDIAAIADFAAPTKAFKDRLLSDLTAALIKEGVRLVDRQNLAALHAEQEYQAMDFVDDYMAVSLGHELGATVIVLVSAANMADYCRLNFRVLSVESAEILALFTTAVRYDAELRRLLTGGASGAGLGSTHFAAGARLGAGFEMNSADEDMVGTGYTPKEKSNTALNAALYCAFRFNDLLSLQAEGNFMLNNGMEISGQGQTIKIDYTTIDIPLLLRWNFMQTPLIAGIFAGPYVSLPMGKLNLSVGSKGSALDTKGYTLGAAGGFTVSWQAGPGKFTLDARYINDFDSLYVREDFGEGVEDANICIRRSVNVSAGYEFSL